MASYQAFANFLGRNRFIYENYLDLNQPIQVIKYTLEFNNQSQFVLSPIFDQPNFNIFIYLIFKDRLIDTAMVEVDNEAFKSIPKEVKKQNSKSSNYPIKVIDNSVFQLILTNTIKYYDNQIAIRDWMNTINTGINEYISQIIAGYFKYLENPSEWILTNIPHKKDSIFLNWGLEKNCKWINID